MSPGPDKSIFVADKSIPYAQVNNYYMILHRWQCQSWGLEDKLREVHIKNAASTACSDHCVSSQKKNAGYAF